MTQPSSKRRERRRRRYNLLLVEFRLLGASPAAMRLFERTTPNSYNIKVLSNTIASIRDPI